MSVRLFSPLLPCSGVNIGGAGSYVYDTPANNNPPPTCVDAASKTEEKRTFVPKAPSKGAEEATFCLCSLLCSLMSPTTLLLLLLLLPLLLHVACVWEFICVLLN